jgi:heat shock protein HslJ
MQPDICFHPNKKIMKNILFALVVLASCSTQKNQTDPATFLYGKDWTLTKLNGQAVVPSSSFKNPFLRFEKGKVNGNAGCNSLSGSFSLGDVNAIHFAPLMTTKMACPGLQTETDFLAALAQVDHFSITGNRLQLLKGDEVVAELQQ